MKLLVLVCLALVVAEFTAYACTCHRACPGGHHVCVGTNNSLCVCVDDVSLGRRSATHGKVHGNRKGLKRRTKHMKAPLSIRKKAKVARLHRKKAHKN